MKNLLLALGFSISLFVYGADYIHAQEIPEHVRKYGKRLERISSGEHILVKLANDIDIYLVTSINGYQVNFLAEKLGISPIMPNKRYSCCRIAFPSNNLELKQMAKKLDTDGDGIITLEEFGDIY